MGLRQKNEVSTVRSSSAEDRWFPSPAWSTPSKSVCIYGPPAEAGGAAVNTQKPLPSGAALLVEETWCAGSRSRRKNMSLKRAVGHGTK